MLRLTAGRGGLAVAALVVLLGLPGALPKRALGRPRRVRGRRHVRVLESGLLRRGCPGPPQVVGARRGGSCQTRHHLSTIGKWRGTNHTQAHPVILLRVALIMAGFVHRQSMHTGCALALGGAALLACAAVGCGGALQLVLVPGLQRLLNIKFT